MKSLFLFKNQKVFLLILVIFIVSFRTIFSQGSLFDKLDSTPNNVKYTFENKCLLNIKI